MLKRTTTTVAVTAPQGRSGFTLMEMLVVVAIIIIIAGAATPLVLNYLHNARLDRAKMDIKTIETAVVAYQAKKGYFPESLQILLQPDPEIPNPLLEQKQLLDPWNNPYTYAGPQGPFTRNGMGPPIISSGGPNGQMAEVLNNNNSK